ncbi:MAG TPA: tetratricopeptide repeat protein [Bryobacteraceae bacterium]|nr:tetratricopeptide repeat protein [Bryobacteraceae bacterium]
MTRQRFTLLFLLVMTLFAAGCSPEAKKKRALEGGNKYFEKGQYKQARLMYLNAIKVDPRFGEAYYQLALTNMQLGSFGEAVGNLQRTVELQPENLDAHSKLADIYLNAYAANPAKYKNILSDIRDLSLKLEKRGKGSFEDLRLRGFLALADGKSEEGLALFKEADKKKPGQQVLQLTIARTLLAMRKYDEASAYTKALIEKDKSLGAAYDLLYGLAMVQSKPEDAEKVLVLRTQNNPKDSANRLRLAAHYYVGRRVADMEKVLNETLADKTNFPNAHMDVGDFYYRIREYDRAAATYQEGAKQDAAKARVFEKRLVEVRVAQNRAPEALELCEKILREDKNDSEAIAMRASLWLYAGKPEQINTAISELQSVVNKMQDNFVLRYNLGRALMAKGDLDGARLQFVDALKYRPDYLPARIALAQVQITRQEYAAALSAANEILQIDPNNQYARLIKSHAFMAQGKYEDSKLVLQETLKLNPGQKDAKYQLGYVLFKEGKLKEAEALFQEVYAQNPPDLRGLMGLTEVYTIQKQPDRALKLLDEAIEKFPKATPLQIAWGNIAVRSGRADDALRLFQKIIEGDPKNFDMQMRLAATYQAKGDTPSAIEAWKKAGEIMPNHIAPVLSRAMALDSLSRRSEAAPLYEQVLKTEPDNVVALNNYSFYLADSGNNLDLALTYAQKAKSKAPNDPMIADTLGFVYLKKNLGQNAASIFSELTDKHPKIALFHIRLATAYLQIGDRPKARKELDDARKNNPTKTDQDEIQKLANKIG